MGREPRDYRRKHGIKADQLFIIACEGEKTEPAYFNDLKLKFKNNRIHVELLKRQPGKSAPKHVFESCKDFKKEYKLNSDDEIWLIIDRDRYEAQLTEISKQCKNSNLFPGVSNPCFELWLLLHIKDINDYDDLEKKKIYENKKVLPAKKRTYINGVIKELLGSYNPSRIDTTKFLPNVYDAINRAKEIDKPEEDWPQFLGTRVHKLVEKIIPAQNGKSSS